MWVSLVSIAAYGSFILPSLRMIILPRETKKQHVGGDTGRQVIAIKTLRNKPIACIDDITIYQFLICLIGAIVISVMVGSMYDIRKGIFRAVTVGGRRIKS
jgi:hypothetical protein